MCIQQDCVLNGLRYLDLMWAVANEQGHICFVSSLIHNVQVPECWIMLIHEKECSGQKKDEIKDIIIYLRPEWLTLKFDRIHYFPDILSIFSSYKIKVTVLTYAWYTSNWDLPNHHPLKQVKPGWTCLILSCFSLINCRIIWNNYHKLFSVNKTRSTQCYGTTDMI